MSFNKNQKSYNKQVMQTGKEANKYLSNALGLINQYTSDYSGRLDYYTNKLNNRYLDLVSDKYLAQNANMLRGAAAFGSNSELNQQIENNAYSQQNALANINNANVAAANQLQQNELNALMNAASTYQKPIQTGMTAAKNVDAANNAWLGALGKGMQAVGTVSSVIPGGQAIGAGLTGVGGALSGIADTSSAGFTPDQLDNMQGQFINMAYHSNFGNNLGQDRSGGLSTMNNQNTSTLGTGNLIQNEIRRQVGY